jgi:hypothetical protein
MNFSDPAFWRAGAISMVVVMAVVLIMLTIDTLAAISRGGSHVPPLYRAQPAHRLQICRRAGHRGAGSWAAPSRCGC